jgi:hypothetical protein
MSDLIKRLEALDAPCRECDIEVARFKYGRDAVRRGGLGWPDDAIIVPCYPGWEIMPSYTASLDAAMTLVPEELRRQVYTGYFDGVIAWAGIAGNPTQYAKELPMAICIAALRAQEASHDGR